MPLFKSRPADSLDNDERVVERDAATTPPRRGGLFTRRRSADSLSERSYHTGASTNGRGSQSPPPRKTGFFGRRRSSESSSDRAAPASSNGSVRRGGSLSSSAGTGIFGFGNPHRAHVRNDPSIIAARQKVADAERAEAEADRALNQARGMVREAKEHVKFLEREAKEEELRAKAKQAETKVVARAVGGLGRHGS